VRQSPANVAVSCVYRVENWGGDLVMRTLRTHPLVIIIGYFRKVPIASVWPGASYFRSSPNNGHR
jgi:hypothetical protein